MPLELSSIKLDLLYHFHQIATHQSLKKAARHLHLTPPAVTHALARLEAALGCKLCVRGKPGFKLTDAGRQLFASTETIFAELQGTLESLGAGDDFTGVLHVGLLNGLANDDIDRALIAIMRRYQSCKIDLRVTDPDEINRLLYLGDLHVGFGIFFKRLEKLTYIPVGSQTLAYYISDRHPLWARAHITREDLFGQRVAWIDTEKKDNFALETEVFGEHPKYKMRVSAYSNSLDGGVRILLSGQAVVPLPIPYMERFMRANKRRVRRLKVDTKAPTLAIECAYNPKLPMMAPVRALLKRLQPTGSAPLRQ